MSRHQVPTPDAMDALGAKLAAGLAALDADPANDAPPGCVVYLHGELGAGKTTLVRGVLHALGYDGRVKSPTYTLIESYPVPQADRELHHLDLYRLVTPDEVTGLALRDLPVEDWLLIEWPEKGTGALPPADLVAYLEHAGSGRVVSFDALTPVGRVVVDKAGF
jgi:tRNA threonylcarbamoyladenosine biosynthesis protein TsaE